MRAFNGSESLDIAHWTPQYQTERIVELLEIHENDEVVLAKITCTNPRLGRSRQGKCRGDHVKHNLLHRLTT